MIGSFSNASARLKTAGKPGDCYILATSRPSYPSDRVRFLTSNQSECATEQQNIAGQSDYSRSPRDSCFMVRFSAGCFLIWVRAAVAACSQLIEKILIGIAVVAALPAAYAPRPIWKSGRHRRCEFRIGPVLTSALASAAGSTLLTRMWRQRPSARRQSPFLFRMYPRPSPIRC